jgi:integrase/recombinase XerD
MRDMKVINHKGFIYVLSMYKKTHLAEIGAKPRTKKNYDVFFNNVMGFISNRTEILIDEIDIDFVIEYKDYLSSYIESVTHVSRNLEFIKATLEYAVDKDLIPKNPMRKFKTKRDEIPDIVFLNKPELDKFASYKGQHQQAKDMFLLQCYTGMSYGDLWSYDMVTDDHGDWIFNKRNKNNKKYWVPLIPQAKEIGLKYKLRFNYINNYDYNYYIRHVAESQNIIKHLTSHIARKTFATTMYQEGWTVEAIADMMGIHILTLLRYYINRGRMRIESELKERTIKTA